MAATLKCDGLAKRFGARQALENVTLELAPGRIVGLLGPNGSGKTTLIKLACGLLTPTAGAVTICGLAPGTKTKKLTAYLPDRVSLPQGRVNDAVALYRDFFADFDEPKARAMLADLKIGGAEKLGALSKGTLEKVQLVLTMSRAAKLYLLDEPIGGVDPAARDYILNTIIRSYSEDATLLISTHLIGDVEKVLDDVVMLQNGAVRLTGSVDEIREQYGASVDAVFREVFKCSENY